jgi:hypothetical protein
MQTIQQSNNKCNSMGNGKALQNNNDHNDTDGNPGSATKEKQVTIPSDPIIATLFRRSFCNWMILIL